MKKSGLIKWFTFGLVLVLVLVASFAWAQPATKKKPFKIGYIMALSGLQALVGTQELLGFKLGVADINKAGGLLGHPIEYWVRDDKNDPAEATKVARDLVNNVGVDWLMGTIASHVSLAVSQVAKETKTPFIVEGATSSSITGAQGHRYVFMPFGNSYTQAGAEAMSLSKKPFKTYALMAPDFVWGRDSARDFKKILLRERPDVQFLKEDFFPATVPDYGPYINQLLSTKPDCAMVFLPAGQAVTFLKQVGPYGLHKKCQLGGFFVTQEGLEAIGKEMPEGVHVYSHFYFNYPTPESQKFAEKVKKELGVTAGAIQWLGYHSSLFLKAAVEKARTIEKEAVINAFEGLSLRLTHCTVNIRPFDHQGDYGQMFGYTKLVPEYPNWAIIADLEYWPGTNLLPTKEEIMKLREGTK